MGVYLKRCLIGRGQNKDNKKASLEEDEAEALGLGAASRMKVFSDFLDVTKKKKKASESEGKVREVLCDYANHYVYTMECIGTA